MIQKKGDDQMDETTLVLQALTKGARALEGNSLSEAGQDAYEQLKSFVKHRIRDKGEASMLLDRFDEEPEALQSQMRSLLVEGRIHEDEPSLEKARELLTFVDPDQSAEDAPSNDEVDPQEVVDVS